MKLLRSIVTGFPLILFSCIAWGQCVQCVGPQNNGLGQMRTIDHSTWAVLTNIANLARGNGIAAGLSYEQRFGLSTLGTRIAALNYSCKYGAFGGLMMQSGYKKSLINRYGISYSRTYRGISAGLQLNYLTHRTDGADVADAFYSSAGLLIGPFKSISMAVFIQNPEQSQMDYEYAAFHLSSLFCLGMRWSLDQHVIVLAELEKEFEYRPLYKAGIQFNFKKRLWAGLGMVGKPVALTFGGGVAYDFFRLDVGFNHHSLLGLTSSLGVTVKIQQKK